MTSAQDRITAEINQQARWNKGVRPDQWEIAPEDVAPLAAELYALPCYDQAKAAGALTIDVMRAFVRAGGARIRAVRIVVRDDLTPA